MSEKQRVAAAAIATGLIAWLIFRDGNKPRLVYKWLNDYQLQFSFSQGSNNVNGVAEITTDGIQSNVQWFGNTAFSIISQSDSIMFQIQDGNNIIFSQTVNKPA